MAVLLLQLQGHAGTEEVTVAVEALGPVVEAALVVALVEEAAVVAARVEEAALVVAAAIGCTYNSRSTCSGSRRSSRTMVGQRAQPKVFPVLILAEKLSGFCTIYFELAVSNLPLE